jgi:flavodoxin
MKNILSLFLAIGLCTASGCSNAQPIAADRTSAEKILIVYLSRTNNTKIIAEMIQQNTGGKLVALELVTPYPDDYRATVEQVVHENETGFLPPLKTRIDSIQQYDVIFVGFPTWGMKLPPPMKSFLKQYDLRGKTIVPFNTNDGYGIGSSFETVKALCPDSKVLEGFSIRGGRDSNDQPQLGNKEKNKEAETKVKQWLQEIKLIRSTIG